MISQLRCSSTHPWQVSRVSVRPCGLHSCARSTQPLSGVGAAFVSHRSERLFDANIMSCGMFRCFFGFVHVECGVLSDGARCEYVLALSAHWPRSLRRVSNRGVTIQCLISRRSHSEHLGFAVEFRCMGVALLCLRRPKFPTWLRRTYQPRRTSRCSMRLPLERRAGMATQAGTALLLLSTGSVLSAAADEATGEILAVY